MTTSKAKTLDRAIEKQLVSVRKQNLRRLHSIEHRLEYVDQFGEVEYINDAKAMDLNSTWYSIDSMTKPIIWIVNSPLDGDDLSLLSEFDLRGIKAIIIIGEEQGRLGAFFQDAAIALQSATDVYDAVQQAQQYGEEGDAVLYSPAFAAEQAYLHFKECGQQFRKAVREVQL